MDPESVAKRAEIMKEVPDVEEMPIFMKSLDPKSLTPKAAETLEALSLLRYEGMNAHEIAEELKKQGNEVFRKAKTQGELKTALAMYDDAVAQESGNAKANSIYHSNRAAVLLRLKRYQGAIDACLAALENNPGNIKAFYRATKGHLGLGNLEMALRLGQAGLLAAEDEKGGIAAAKELALLVAKIDDDIKAKAKAEEEAAAAKAAIDAALANRGVDVGPPLFERADGTIDVAKIDFVDRSVGDMLQFPVLLLYPEAGQTDFIQTFGELDSFADHMTELYPPAGECAPWDTQGAYTIDSIALYALPCIVPPNDPKAKKAYNKRVARKIKPSRIDLSANLLTAITTTGYVLPDIPTFHVVVSGSDFEREWLANPH